jgi:toxin-antitoxin system PIN domain toxin
VLAVDTNVLVYAHRREVPEHGAASAVMRDLAEGRTPWALPWPCVYEFFSVVTSARIWKDAASAPQQAWAQVEAWLGSPTLRLLGETDGFASILARFVRRPRVRGPVVHDARIAALCIAHGVEALLTRDRDFALFSELETRDPFT